MTRSAEPCALCPDLHPTVALLRAGRVALVCRRCWRAHGEVLRGLLEVRADDEASA